MQTFLENAETGSLDNTDIPASTSFASRRRLALLVFYLYSWGAYNARNVRKYILALLQALRYPPI